MLDILSVTSDVCHTSSCIMEELLNGGSMSGLFKMDGPISLDKEENIRELEDPQLIEKMAQARAKYDADMKRIEITDEEVSALEEGIKEQKSRQYKFATEMRELGLDIDNMFGDICVCAKNAPQTGNFKSKLLAISDQVEKMLQTIRDNVTACESIGIMQDHTVGVLMKYVKDHRAAKKDLSAAEERPSEE